MEIGKNGPVLFWIEDRPVTVAPQELILKQAGIPFHMYGTPSELTSVLNDVLTDAEIDKLRIGFVIDIMLFGVSDLRSLDIWDAPTGNGVHAGYVFVDRFLRMKTSRFLNKPVCFLTERTLDEELMQDIVKLRDRSGGTIEIIQKYKDTELPKFRKFLEGI
ncbi:MAG: hypothetical protein QOJ15_1167 [Bradyrhizobium sp.]|jgi:hypothetical protein|nr:hypothetical protein [Bradyrhizobium sp.]